MCFDSRRRQDAGLPAAQQRAGVDFDGERAVSGQRLAALSYGVLHVVVPFETEQHRHAAASLRLDEQIAPDPSSRVELHLQQPASTGVP
jgi:hypothetical protein